MSTDVDVIIAGGGPGGLALAQGLRKNGISVAVIEKDRTRADYVQGFRLGLRSRGYEALKQNLPAELLEAFDATVGRSPTETTLVDERLRTLDIPLSALRAAGSETEDLLAGRSVSRITLRQILLSGLGDAVRFGTFSRYEETQDGVTAHLEDGSAITGKLLVGADGTSSRVRRQKLPHASSIDTGVRRLAGKITLASAVRVGLPSVITDTNVMVRPASGRSLVVTSHRVNPEAFARYGLIGANDATHRDIAGFHFDNTTSYTWWNTAYGEGELGSDDELSALDGAGLVEVLLGKLGGWSDDLRDLIRFTDPSTVALLKVRSSVPVPAWTPGRVTLLGDAIHAMTYFRALGGNSAIYDSGVLVRELVEAFAGRKTLLEAVADYEVELQRHGTQAVETSLSAMRRHVFGAEAVAERAARATA